MQYCKQCNKEIKPSRRFCNSSCAALFNNKQRAPMTQENKQRRSITQKGRKSPKLGQGLDPIHRERALFKAAIIGPYTKVYRNICNVTGKIFYSVRFQKYSTQAIKESRALYRAACRFDFNVYKDHNFDITIIKEHGWYHPNINPNGVSRDHMFSVEDGWRLKIDPSILKHPANCKLMLHLENQSKNTKSTISYDQLLQRIKTWSL